MPRSVKSSGARKRETGAGDEATAKSTLSKVTARCATKNSNVTTTARKPVRKNVKMSQSDTRIYSTMPNHLIPEELTFSLRGAETASEACWRSVPLEAFVRL
jgi:hypothetical protein